MRSRLGAATGPLRDRSLLLVLAEVTSRGAAGPRGCRKKGEAGPSHRRSVAPRRPRPARAAAPAWATAHRAAARTDALAQCHSRVSTRETRRFEGPTARVTPPATGREVARAGRRRLPPPGSLQSGGSGSLASTGTNEHPSCPSQAAWPRAEPVGPAPVASFDKRAVEGTGQILA
jgi:hypothetical protein